MKKFFAILISIMLVLAITLPAAAISTIAVKSIKLDNTKISIKVGDTAALKATLTPANTTESKLTYVTANKNVATVSIAGIVNGVHEGSTVVTVYTANKAVFAKCNVSVTVSYLKPVTIRMYFPGQAMSAAPDVYKAISAKFPQLKAKFEGNWIPFNDFPDKMSVMAAAGDNWDINFDGNWLSYPKMVNKGAYLPLNDLLPKYAPDVYAAMQKAGTIQAASIAGKIMCIPWEMKMNQTLRYLWFRTDLTDKYGITIDSSVKTAEDVDKVLHQAKNLLPKTQEVMGWDQGDYGVPESMYMERDELNNLDFGHRFVMDLNDGTCKVVPFEQTKAFKDAAVLAKKWYDDGIIAKNMMVDKEQYSAKTRSGVAFSALASHEIATMNTQFADPTTMKSDYVGLYADKKTANRSALANLVAINKNAANPERSLMFLNLLSTSQEMYDLLIYGIKGKTYELDGQAAVYPKGMNGSTSNYQDYTGVWGFWKPQFMRPNSMYPAGFWQKEAQVAATPPQMENPLDGLFVSTDNVKNEVAARDQIFSESGKLLQYGAVTDVNKAVADYIQKQKAAGVDKIVADIQKQVDAFLAAKK